MKANYSQRQAKLALRKSKQAGLTLIELLVVLVILIGIGGLLVPTINNALTRTHVSTCAQTFPEVHQMMQRVQLEFGEFGTDFDSGIFGTGTTTGTVGQSVNGANVENLTADEVTALAAVGIAGVVDHNDSAADYNVTFNIGSVARPLVADTPAITLTDAQAEQILLPNAGGTNDGEKYVWFGIGRDWSLLSSLAPEPPVHFGDTAGVLPDEVHSRFGVIMQVADEAGDALERAEFKRTSYSLDGTNFETGDNHIEVYWEEVSGQ
ncbi:MAG: prepilin-type N-terminal cleavage/methylation domain-containing protein [Verrucomicrobiota bacterium]